MIQITGTQQELFDKIFTGLRSQGFERSMVGSSCKYRGEQGRKCAVGYLIPDSHYTEELEGSGLYFLDTRKQVSVPKENLLFLCELQNIHDCSHQMMEEELRRFAEKNQLTVPE